MSKFAWLVLGWVLSGAVHMVVGGYVVYRWRRQIDAVVEGAEAVFKWVYGKVKGA